MKDSPEQNNENLVKLCLLFNLVLEAGSRVVEGPKRLAIDPVDAKYGAWPRPLR